MRETWYVLEDGSVVDPNEVAPDENGNLVHKSGVAVAMKGDVPHSKGVDIEDLPAKDMTPEAPKRGYKTRKAKAR